MFQFVLDDMTNRKIDYSHCVYHDCEAPISSILLNESTGSRTIIHSNPNMPYVTYDDFKGLNLNDFGWIHFEGRHPADTLKMMESVVDFNKEKLPSDRITISLDLEKLQEEIVSLSNLADVVIIGKEFVVHLGYENKTSAVHSFRQLTKNGNIIICPWGTDGVAALDSNDNLFTAEAYPPDNVIDSLGAGDTFAAAIIFALYQNYALNFAIHFASRLAGYKVSFFGYDKIREHFDSLL
ncbi:Ketohexokinase, partial [Pseudolycoriella hygida]